MKDTNFLSKEDITQLCMETIGEHTDIVEKIKTGTGRGFLIGQTIKKTKGKYIEEIIKTISKLLSDD